MTFQKAFDDYLQFCSVERRLSNHTVSAYFFDLLDFRKWLPLEKAIEEVKNEDLKLYLADMVSERNLSVATVRRRLACLRGFFRRQSELVGSSNPFDDWRPKLPRRRRLPRALARSEVLSLLRENGEHQSNDEEFHIAIGLLVATGLRVGELCSVRIDDVSPDCACIRVHGKGSRDRIAYVTNRSLRAGLGKMVARRRAECGNDAPLLLNRLGAPIRPQSIRSRLRGRALCSGIQRRITPHMLRHTAATLLIETGVDIRFVQRLLGHANIATTEIYTHVTDQALQSTLERADVLASLRGG